MHYLDASCCVAALTPESGTLRTGAWLADQSEGDLAISPWVHAEVASALSIKVRTASLTVDERSAVLAGWLALRQGLVSLSITEEIFSLAADMAGRHELALRAGDALHLAIAATHGCTLVTLDDRMAKAAEKLGVPVAAI
jgi:predicted nucleic acid-binding protein